MAFTAEHLGQLLAVLGDAPAERYESLRWRLVRLFTWERCEPEALAGEALDRSARRLSEGEAAAHTVRKRTKLAEFAREQVRLSLRLVMTWPSGCGAVWLRSNRSSADC